MGQVFMRGGSWDGRVGDDGGLNPEQVLTTPRRNPAKDDREVEQYVGTADWHSPTEGEPELPVRQFIGTRPAR